MSILIENNKQVKRKRKNNIPHNSYVGYYYIKLY